MNAKDYTWKVREGDVRAAEKVLRSPGATAGDYREALSTLLSFAEEVEG